MSRSRIRAVLRGALLSLVTVLTLSLSLWAPQAVADDSADERAKLSAQIKRSRSDLHESTAQLAAAAAAADLARSRLAQAQAGLARTRRELAVARARDWSAAVRLKRAQLALGKAKAAVTAGQRQLTAQQEVAAAVVRDQYQQRTNLLPLAILVQSSTADLETRLQWSTTMFDTTQAEIDRLARLQQQLLAQQAQHAAWQKRVSAGRAAAGQALQTKRELERRAVSEAATVAVLVRQRQVAERRAANEVAADRRRYAELTEERRAVEERIGGRIKKEKGSGSHRKKKHSKSSHEPDEPTPVGMRAAGHGFSFPVDGPITSAYGKRFHPVLHYWKLHDGTDFGSACGTPIRAARPGKVVDRYSSPGYGKRLMIDHGEIDGRYVTTGYNHAARYVVKVGDHVSEGEVIGYVGSTGYATGCHLHLMVWLDGKTVNPMKWF